MNPDAFYEPLDDARFQATSATMGPWDPDRTDGADRAVNHPDGSDHGVDSAGHTQPPPLPQPSGLCRPLVVADSGNGISAALDLRRWLFINTDLTVTLHRHPAGEWVHMRARTTLDPDGVGVADSVLSDAHGRVGRGLQSLLVARRDSAPA